MTTDDLFNSQRRTNDGLGGSDHCLGQPIRGVGSKL